MYILVCAQTIMRIKLALYNGVSLISSHKAWLISQSEGNKRAVRYYILLELSGPHG